MRRWGREVAEGGFAFCLSAAESRPLTTAPYLPLSSHARPPTPVAAPGSGTCRRTLQSLVSRNSVFVVEIDTQTVRASCDQG